MTSVNIPIRCFWGSLKYPHNQELSLLQPRNTHVQFKVLSIDSIKGLDAGTCVIILSSNTLKYITPNAIGKANCLNKEWKRAYVVLTRAKKILVLALDHELLTKEDMATVRDS